MNSLFKVDFIGIGTGKAGTTWLAKALEAHPDICFSKVKETNFFCREYRPTRGTFFRYDGTNIDQYRFFFKRCHPGQIRGEFSVHYMRDRTAPDTIYRHFPNVKIIAVLREPMSRFLSAYRYGRHTIGTDSRSLEALIHPDGAIAHGGMYGELLERYFARFPRKNIKVLIYEEMKEDPRAALQDLYAFLGVDGSFVPHELIGKTVNPTTRVRFTSLKKMIKGIQLIMIRLGIEWIVPDSTEAWITRFLERMNYVQLDEEVISDGTKEKIRQLYREDRKKLEALLGRDLTKVWGNA